MIRRLLLSAAVFTVACTDPPPRTPAAPPTRPVNAAPIEEPTPTSELVPVNADDPVLGPKNAPITIVVFSDFQCPFCKRAEPTLATLRGEYGDQLRIVWKDLPLSFHKHAREAAIVARVVQMTHGNESFWRMHARIFEEQAQLSTENLHAWAAELGVDEGTLAVYRAEAEARVERSLDESKRLAIAGTPNFLVNGQLLSGAQPAKKFRAVIDAHLVEAKQLAAAGTPPSAIYPALVKKFWQQPPPEEEEEDEPVDATVWGVPVGTAPVRGPKDALVTIVTFSDFQCPFCKRVEATFADLEKAYPGKLRFVWKNQPLSFHKRAIPAAIAAIEVRKQKGDAAFWAFHDKVFAAQSKLADEDLEAAATEIAGIDGKKVLAAIEKEKWRSEVEDDVDEAEALNVSGTPHSFVNGRRFSGSQPFAKWKKLIDEELAKAEARVKAGTAADKVYDEIVKDGKSIAPVNLAIPADAPWRGGAKAKVVLHVFSDFQCTFCRRLAREVPVDEAPESATLEKLLKKYGDKIKIVWRDFPLPFHPRAMAAATFAREAKKQKGMAVFWKVHDDVFDLAGSLEDDKLEAIAKRHGIAWTKARDAISAGSYDAIIEADRTAGTAAGVSGTPATFVNGRAIKGAQGEAVFVRAIDRALAKK